MQYGGQTGGRLPACGTLFRQRCPNGAKRCAACKTLCEARRLVGERGQPPDIVGRLVGACKRNRLFQHDEPAGSAIGEFCKANEALVDEELSPYPMREDVCNLSALTTYMVDKCNCA